MPNYDRLLLDSIEREKKGTDYFCSKSDKVILSELLKEINEHAGTNLQYLAELDAFNIRGIGTIIARYFSEFSSESVRAYLIPKLVFDRIPDCDKIVLQSYFRFQLSDEYISKAGAPAPAHIYTRYDNAFKILKPKRLKEDLLKLASSPRDAFYLPLTMRMLASWKIPELKDLFISYLSVANITAHDIGLKECDEKYLPPLSFIKRELRFTAIAGLKYYPSTATNEVIKQYTIDSDPDIKAAAKRTLRALLKERSSN